MKYTLNGITIGKCANILFGYNSEIMFAEELHVHFTIVRRKSLRRPIWIGMQSGPYELMIWIAKRCKPVRFIVAIARRTRFHLDDFVAAKLIQSVNFSADCNCYCKCKKKYLSVISTDTRVDIGYTLGLSQNSVINAIHVVQHFPYGFK